MASTREEQNRQTEASLKHDPDLNTREIGRRFLHEDGWLNKLPESTQKLIFAVQATGEHPDRSIFLHKMGVQIFTLWKASRSRENLESAIAFHAISIKYTKSDDSQIPARLDRLAFAQQARWELTQDDIDLENTVHLFRSALNVAEELHQPLGGYVTNLAYILYQRWDRTKSPDDRQEAKVNYLRAIELAGEHPLLPQMLSNYGEFVRLTLDRRFGSYEDDIEEAVTFNARATAALRPDRPLPYHQIWRNAAIAYHSRFKINGSEDDFQTALRDYRTSLAFDGPSKSKFLSELADHYLERARQKNTRKDIEEALAIYSEIMGRNTLDFSATIGKADTLRLLADLETTAQQSQGLLREACQLADEAVSLVDESDNSRGWAYFRTSAIYNCRFEVDGQNEHLDRSVELAIKSLAYTEHNAIWDFGRWCATVCRTRHVNNGDLQDLEQAFSAINMAIDNLNEWDLENLADCTWQLGVCWLSRFNCTGQIAHLDESLTWLTASCLPGPGRAHTLGLIQNDLANALCLKFEHSSSVEDLDLAIENYALAGENFERAGLVPQHGQFAMIRNGIGQAMLQRHNYWGSRDDLVSAIDAFSSSYEATDVNKARIVSRACNLSYALQMMFVLDKNMQWLKRAQKYLTTVLESPKIHGAILDQLINSHMGNIYLRCYFTTTEPTDLDLAIRHFEIAKSYKLDDKRIWADVTSNLAMALGKKAENSQKADDFDATIATFEESEALEEMRTAQLLVTRLNKAEFYFSMFESSKKQEYGQKALEGFSNIAIADTVQPAVRLRAADAASVLEVRVNNDFEAAFEQISRAIRLLPEVISLLSNRLEQLRFVRKYHYLPSSAAALAIAAKISPEEIVTMLELSRSFIWDRFLLAESHFDELRSKHPQLANRLDSLRTALASQVSIDSDTPIATMVPKKDRNRLERHVKSDEYQHLLKEIRQEVGFGNFPLPSDQRDSLQMAKHEAIVFVNMSHYRRDAIIKLSHGVQILPLIDVSQDQVIAHAAMLQYSLSDGVASDKAAKFDDVMRWLWYTITKPIIDHLATSRLSDESSPIDDQYKIYWVSFGWLGIFPIHAAGDFSIEHASVHDQSLSVSIPSIRVLRLVRERQKQYSAQRSSVPQSAFLVGMPTTPGMGSDSAISAQAEISSICGILTSSLAAGTVEQTLSPDFKEVTSRLPTATIAHFATHATADAKDPSLSTIRLVDWQTRPFNVRAILGGKALPPTIRAQSVFLSACETAMSKDLLVRDEGVHIAGAFLMKGATRVVAGLWKVQDQAAREVAEAFYRDLMIVGQQDRRSEETRDEQGFNLDTLHLTEHRTTAMISFDRAAEALHEAVGNLRKRGVPPIIWGAFVYMGP